MSLKIIVVGSLSSQPGELENLQSYKKYFQGAVGKDTTVYYSMLDDLFYDISISKFSIFDTRNGFELKDYDLIILRGKLRQELDLVIAISNYAEINNIPLFNDYKNSRNISKVVQAVTFYKLGLPFPRTLYGPIDYLEQLIKNGSFKLPFIYKSRFGAHGNNNFLINKFSQISKSDSYGMIAQEYIPNDCDYRILIIGEQHLVIKRQSASKSHLNNTSKGGSATLVKDFDKDIITKCHELAKISAMATAGVDVIIDIKTGRHYFLEINSQPQLQTGAFVKEKQALVGDLIKSLLR